MEKIIRIFRSGFFTVLILMNPAAVAVLVWRFHVDVPYWDQWDFVPDLNRLFSGQLDLSFLFRQHNEHRMFFPRLIMLALARFTHWRIGWELVVGYLITWGIFLLLVKQLFRLYPQIHRRFLVWPVILFSLLTFSMNQLPNWYWGWLIQFFLGVLATMICLSLIIRTHLSWKILLWSLFWGVVASYSFGNSLLLWPIGLLLLVLKSLFTRKWSTVHLTVWTIGAVLVFGLYFIGYVKSESHSSLGMIYHYPIVYVKYILTFLGSSISVSHANIWGGVGLVLWFVGLLYLMLQHQKQIELLMLSLGFGLFAVGSAMVIGVGRLGFGIWQAKTPRYIIISNLLWFALIFLGIEIFKLHQNKIKQTLSFLKILRRHWIVALGLVAIVLFVGFNLHFVENKIRQGFRVDQIKARQISLLESRRELMSLESDSLLVRLYPDPQVIRERVEILKQHRLSVFRNQ